ncbi:hypothetical protein F5879DRAFT_924541 [Lentinula edodes]|nr:hypothetical protein HHX47_DHR1001117 [Lentinula edodes]KAJ3879704.1 hypothetical protein F5051DRAFT_193145 [Lentinula edodes]KAJ3895803.1 hypothetical protein GG344DRAFT_38157 [Lentinula edodes]KAJ3901570.1 hypothetical protein F5879DRAFT_924541 [Lentinula edodes]KAJ3922045.1 hypothetical protein F5877DRAFT_75601 [Lentinula edodes]
MSLDFESTLSHSSFMEPMESPSFLLDSSMDYLQYPTTTPPSPPSYSSALGLSNTTSSPMTFHTVPLSSLGEYGYAPVSFSPRPYTPADNASISPPTLTYSLSNADASSDDQHSGRHSRGSNPSPPPSVPYAATVPRSHRFNPIGVPPPTRTSARTAATKRRNSKTANEDSDDPEEEEYQQSTGSVDPRREAVRRQRIESEQKRRDELRDGYARLKSTLPSINQKSSKVTLLDRAASHIKYLDAVRNRLETQLKAADDEVSRLRNVNEALMLGTANQRHAAAAMAAVNAGMVPTSF